MQRLSTPSAGALLQMLANSRAHLVYALDREQRYTWLEGHLLDAWGINPAEFIGRSLAEIPGPLTQPAHIQAITRALAGESVDFAWETRGPGGEECLECTVSPWREEDGRIAGAIGIVRAVTAQKERQVASLCANLPGMAYRREVDNPFPTLISDGAVELTGYDAHTLRSQVPYESLILPEDRERAAAEVRTAVAARRPFAQEYRIRHRDGRTRWVWERGEGVFAADGRLEAVQGFIWNVTERKEAEEQVRLSRDFYLTVLEHFPGMVWRTNPDGMCDYVNQTWLHFTGRSLEQELGDGWFSGVHPDDMRHCVQAYRTAFAGLQPFSVEYRLRHKSGEYRWIMARSEPFYDRDGQLLGYLGFCYDNTYRKQAEERMRKYQLLVTLTSDAVIFLDGESGRILEANHAAEEVYGYSRAELLSMVAPNLLAPSTRVLGYDEVLAADEVRLEELHRRADGTLFSAEVSLVGTRIGRESVLAAIVRDITVRHRRERVQRLLRSLDERILQSQPQGQILRVACTELAEIFDSPLVWIGVPEADGVIRPLVMVGPLATHYSGMKLRWDVSPTGQGPVGRAIRTGRIQMMAVTDPAFAHGRDQAERLGVKHVVALPLLVEGRPQGALCLYSKLDTPFDGHTMADLTGFAVQMGLSMEHANQLEQIRLQSAALSAVARAVVITTRNGVIEWVNPAFTALTGYTAEEAIGQNPRLLKSGLQTQAYYHKMWETILAGQVWQGLVRNKRKDGSIYMEEMTITPFRDPAGEISHFVAIKQDITERRRELEHMEHLASHDPLTGLANRRGLEQRIGRAFEAARSGQGASALVMIDMDRFKPVNDTLGHMAGDRLLVELAQVMTTVVRGDDNIARLGGDEFGIVLEHVSEEQAREVAERLRIAVDGYRFQHGTQRFAVSASMGIAMIDGTAPLEYVFARADTALYAAKQGGRNRVALWKNDKITT